MKRWLGIALKFGLSAFLIVLLLDAVDLDKTLSQIAGANPIIVLSGTLVLALQLVVGAMRWQVVLHALGASLGFVKALKIIYIGIFFNQTLPSSVGGDAVRIYKAYKAGLPLATSINGVMLERIATVLGLLVLVVIGQPFLQHRIGAALPLWVFPMLTVLGGLGTVFLMFLDRIPEALSHWQWVRGLAYLAADTRRVFLHLGYCASVIVTSVVGHAHISFGVWVLGLSLGLDDQLTFLDCLVIIPPVLLITTVPISIAGWGVRESSMVAGLGLIGVAPESALVLSILFGLVLIIIALPGGLVWLASSDRHVPNEDELKPSENKTS